MCTNNFLGSFYKKPKNSGNPDMDKITNCIPIFNLFLRELTYGDIVGVESIIVEKTQHKTFIFERSGLRGFDESPTSREINTKLIINVSCISNYWEFEKPIIISQFTSMFKRQFNFIDFDYCLVDIKDSYKL